MNKILHFAFLLFGMTVFAQNLIPGQLDPTFQIGTGFEDGMDALAVQPDGKILVAGQGDTYQGVPFNRIIRLNADGSPDPTFTGMGNLLIYENYNEIALQPDRKILTISHYTNDVNSTTLYYHFKRLNTDGSLDTTFNAGGTGVVETPTSWISNMVVQPDGKIIIVGQFAQYNGVASKNIARLNADGTLDTSFVVGSGFNSSVYSLCMQPDGKVLVSGSFSSYNGSSVNGFTRLNADGTKDTTFTPASSTAVGKMGIQSNGNIVANAAYTINGVNKDGIVILNPNGTVITSNGTLPELTGATNERFLDFVVQPDDKIIAVGYFSQYGGVTIRHILRLTANGFLDNTFNPGSPGAMVQAIAAYPNNRYVISGLFTRYQSQSMNYIARINGLSGIQTPSGNTSQTICGSGTLASLAVTGQGITWYNAATEGNQLSSATPLVNGTTYYASQTISNNESATRLAVTVTLSTQSTPVFTPIGPICSGDSSQTLPTTSTNGVTGTWSPTFSTTTTRAYTFTPAAGQCATTATMTVTVNNNLTPTFTQIAAICPGADLVLPTMSNNGFSGTWSPAVNNTATTTYGFTPDSGQCARTASMTVVVNTATTPTFTPVSAICSGATLSALPTTSSNGIPGTWAPALNNLETTTYTFTPATGQCASTATMTITVNPNATPAFTQVSAICSGGTLSALPVDSNNGINGTWSPALNNLETTTYTFTPAAGQCATTATMTITVNPNATPAFTQVSAICSGGALSALPVDSNNGINGTWSPALNNTA
ncbi:delta-60 repeat domain-containing protein, partial [Flavobacterium noncentrifugens]